MEVLSGGQGDSPSIPYSAYALPPRFLFFCFLGFFWSFLGPHWGHMEVPRLQVEGEFATYTRQLTAMPDF